MTIVQKSVDKSQVLHLKDIIFHTQQHSLLNTLKYWIVIVNKCCLYLPYREHKNYFITQGNLLPSTLITVDILFSIGNCTS